jgi:hypothetical protein
MKIMNRQSKISVESAARRGVGIRAMVYIKAQCMHNLVTYSNGRTQYTFKKTVKSEHFDL